MDPVQRARPAQAPAWDVVGIAEVAARLGVQRGTVDRWRQRGVMPEPTWQLAGGPLWLWPVVAAWARRTGRL